jgi:hypothetical protein
MTTLHSRVTDLYNNTYDQLLLLARRRRPESTKTTNDRWMELTAGSRKLLSTTASSEITTFCN